MNRESGFNVDLMRRVALYDFVVVKCKLRTENKRKENVMKRNERTTHPKFKLA